MTATDPASQCTGELVSAPFIAQVSNLQLISSLTLAGNNRLVGGTCNHHGTSDNTFAKVPANCRTPGNNHYLRATSLSKLNKLQQAWAKTYVNGVKKLGSLRINDASLPSGGSFEATTSGLWKSSLANYGYITHRRGVDVDIGHFDTNWKITVTEEMLNKLNKTYDYTLFRALYKEGNHTHVYLE
ncbi:MAG: hypothetical protein JKY80_09105 [Mariprofundaceae bacterium]|nr:hypothetical protein [Mariprofundaceae bacterium]